MNQMSMFDMYKMGYWLVILIIAFHISVSQAQTVYPSGYFIAPVDYRIFLSGTFGELRDDHFHSGIDIKTGGAEGKNVFAVADGYVSRINISPAGYGKALYITHPNGYISVYGHLKDFNTEIRNYARKEQYRKESFAVDLTLNKDELPVKKGEIIAVSGNSGSSGGPHLHFEFRDAGTQKTINPLLFGIEVKDWVRPKIEALKIYAMDAATKINGKNDSMIIKTTGWGQVYRLIKSDTLIVSGNVAFGIQSYDQQNDDNNPNGVYSIELFEDSRLLFSVSTEKFAFDETRYVNALIDYAEYKRTDNSFIRTNVLPNNRLSIYKTDINKGIFTFADGHYHKMQYVVKDVKGNASILTFYILAHKPEPFDVTLKKPADNLVMFHFDKSNDFEADGIRLHMDEGCLYDDVMFTYSCSRGSKGISTRIHHVHTIYDPVHSYYDLWIKPDSLPAKLISKAYIVNILNGKQSPCGGTIDDEFIKTEVRSFGDYALVIDTVPPTIKNIDIVNNADVKGQQFISLQVSDDGAGIRSYRGTLNGHWILMDYDAKNNLLRYDFDDRIINGPNKFKLVVTDNVNNSKTYELIINY